VPYLARILDDLTVYLEFPMYSAPSALNLSDKGSTDWLGMARFGWESSHSPIFLHFLCHHRIQVLRMIVTS
jgi:hypothetical protein